MEGVGKEPLFWEGSSWHMAGLYPIPRCQLLPCRSHGTCFPLPPTKPQSMAVPQRGLGSSHLANWPTSSSPQASKHPSHRNLVCSKLNEMRY